MNKGLQYPVSHCESSFSVESSDNLSSENSMGSTGRNKINQNYDFKINVNKANRSSGTHQVNVMNRRINSKRKYSK
jgi:hypothetical protein